MTWFENFVKKFCRNSKFTIVSLQKNLGSEEVSLFFLSPMIPLVEVEAREGVHTGVNGKLLGHVGAEVKGHRHFVL